MSLFLTHVTRQLFSFYYILYLSQISSVIIINSSRPEPHQFNCCIFVACTVPTFLLTSDKTTVANHSGSIFGDTLNTITLATSLHLAQKGDSDDHPVGDYRHLNAVTIPDWYPVPNLQNLSADQHGCKVFTKVDLIWAYQIPKNSEDVPKTAVMTPFGSFEFLFTSFWLWNATSTSQWFIDKVVQGLNPVFAYIDNLLITSDKEENHLQHLSQFFQCVFGQSSLEFFGHYIDANGIQSLTSKVDVIQCILHPNSLHQVCHSPRLINFNWRFIPKYISKLLPLTQLLKANKILHLLSSKLNRHSPHAFRHLCYISQFTRDNRHIPGVENLPSDAFPCLPISSPPLPQLT